MPQCGCILSAATDYVTSQEGYPSTFHEDESRFYIKVDGYEVPTKYYWENDLLLTHN